MKEAPRFDTAVLVSVICPPAFAASAAVLRLNLDNVESRLQVGFFWLLAIVVEQILKKVCQLQPSFVRLAVNGIFATVAIAIVKFSSEGFPAGL